MMLFFDGCGEHWQDQTNFARMYDYASNINNFGTGRYGSGQYVTTDSGGLRKTVSVNAPTLVSGVAYSMGFSTENQIIIGFADANMTPGVTGQYQCEARVNSSAQLTVTRNGTVIATDTSHSFLSNVWYYIELKVTFHNTAGVFEARVNGVTWLSATGQNTRSTANNYASQVFWDSTDRHNKVDDLYICDTTGTYNNDFLGECRIYAGFANADGASAVWTPNSGANQYSRLNQTNPDDDTSYTSGVNVGDIFLVSYPAFSPTGAIAAVQSIPCARKDDAGARSIAEVCRAGGTNYTGATKAMTPTYFMYPEIREVNPNTGFPWTTAGLNASQFGAQVIT